MPINDSGRKPHVLVNNSAQSERYTHPSSGGSNKFKLPSRDRSQHGQALLSSLHQIEQAAEAFRNTSLPKGLDKENGIYVQFSSEPGYPLKIESLGNRRKGIETVAIQEIDLEEGQEVKKKTSATVYIPEDQLAYFIEKVDKYLEDYPRTGKPKNQKLVESISQIKMAKLQDLWTDKAEFPSKDTEMWWETWLRYGKDDEESDTIISKFRRQATNANLRLSENEIKFPENTVLLVKGTARQLANSIFLLDSLAELRGAKETAEFFTQMTRIEQQEWVQEATKRIIFSDEDALSVCILDTGVNNGHPMIQPALRDEDMDSYNPNWGKNDTGRNGYGHGTEMAGLCLYGDLFDLLSSSDGIQLNHRLESIKILPPAGENDPELYGAITKECVSRAEILAPLRKRILCMAVTTKDFMDRGRPSSWSAALDEITFGDQDQKYLMFVSVGNIYDLELLKEYPNVNYTEGIHDPAQAWNIVTVGAYTEKEYIDKSIHPDRSPLANKGGLCPSSTTSLIWQDKWPLKPDIVLEGGNMSISNQGDEPPDHSPYSLQLLSTSAQFQRNNYLIPTGDTSAATAQAARLSAIIAAQYPNLWPETVRGLLVHSAEWTEEMLGVRNLSSLSKSEIKQVIRCYGYGVPNLERALYSASNSLTLIAQEKLQPFLQEDSAIKTNELNLHSLPWPKDILLSLGETEVEMHITLSYFVEPNPGSRNNPNYGSKFQYASHGLRFDVKSSTESIPEFKKRINRMARSEGEAISRSSQDSKEWMIGSRLRTSGSIHRDIWRGTAADLAEKEVIAVYPITGWWKERKHLERWRNRIRYSLIVTIKTEEENIDIYTPVLNLVAV